MVYFIIFQSLMVILLLTLYIRSENIISKQLITINILKKEKSTTLHEIGSTELNTANQPFSDDKRLTPRITLGHIECKITLLDIANETLKILKNKSFSGIVEDISLGGLRFRSSYELPVKFHIITNITFKLTEDDLLVKGRIIRREDHIDGQTIIYGVEFVDMHDSQLKHLNLALQNLLS